MPWSFQRLQRVRPSFLGQRPVQATAILVIGTVALAGLGDKQMRFGPRLTHAAELEYDGVYRLIKEVYRIKFAGGATQPKRLITYSLYPLPVAPHAYAFRGLIDGLNIVPLMAAHETELQVLAITILSATMPARVDRAAPSNTERQSQADGVGLK